MPTIIPGVRSDETVSIWWLPTLADPTAPKVSELTGATAVKLECLLSSAPDFSSSVETGKIKRLCSSVPREVAGSRSYSIGDLTLAYDPQSMATALSKGYVALAEGATGYFVLRSGVHVDTAPAALQLVDVWAGTVSTRDKLPPEDNDELKAKVGVTGALRIVENQALVA